LVLDHSAVGDIGAVHFFRRNSAGSGAHAQILIANELGVAQWHGQVKMHNLNNFEQRIRAIASSVRRTSMRSRAPWLTNISRADQQAIADFDHPGRATGG
jgi:hypothetical protein